MCITARLHSVLSRFDAFERLSVLLASGVSLADKDLRALETAAITAFRPSRASLDGNSNLREEAGAKFVLDLADFDSGRVVDNAELEEDIEEVDRTDESLLLVLFDDADESEVLARLLPSFG